MFKNQETWRRKKEFKKDCQENRSKIRRGWYFSSQEQSVHRSVGGHSWQMLLSVGML
jgi:hypothetical protein